MESENRKRISKPKLNPETKFLKINRRLKVKKVKVKGFL